MPIGSFALVPHVVHSLVGLHPAKVLDLGIGFGFYGAAVRQWLDLGLWRGASTQLIGVEAWGAYRSPLWDLYNLIYCQPIPEFLATSTELFDAILLLDVIEHFPKPDGEQLLTTLKNRTAHNGIVLVGTPGLFFPQGDYAGNPFERHQSLWLAEDFRQQDFEILMDGTPDDFDHRMVLARWTRPCN